MSVVSETIRVLVVDDQALVRDGLARIVQAQPGMETVGVAANGDAALARAAELAPDVILMDIRMPGVDGIEATRRLVGEGTGGGTRVIGLTTHDTDAHVLRILNAGAVGFLLKDSTASQLVDAIRTAHNGTFTASMSTTRRLLDRLSEQPPERPAVDPAVLGVLTERERCVFERMVAGASNPEIARELSIAEVTVKTHVGNILTKLRVRDRVHLVIWAHRHGLVS